MTQTRAYDCDEAEILHYPFIKIAPLTINTQTFKATYDWLIFSSANAVHYFESYMAQIDVRHIAVIGSQTAAYCASLGIEVDFCPDQFDQEGFLAQFEVTHGMRICIPSSAAARPLLVDTLRTRGAFVEKVDLYEPVANIDNIMTVQQRLIDRCVDVLTFSSSSAVRYWYDHGALQQQSARHTPAVFAIGPQTEETLQTYGIRAQVSEVATLDAMINKILESWNKSEI